MTVIQFPLATDRPKPGKEPPEVTAQILVLPVIRIERDLTTMPLPNCRYSLAAFKGTEAEAHAWIDAAIAGDLSSMLAPAGAGSD